MSPTSPLPAGGGCHQAPHPDRTARAGDDDTRRDDSAARHRHQGLDRGGDPGPGAALAAQPGPEVELDRHRNQRDAVALDDQVCRVGDAVARVAGAREAVRRLVV